ALTMHTKIEEKLFYPAVRELDDDKLREMVGHSLEEHGEVKQELERLDGLEPSSDEFHDGCKELIDDVKHHVKEEEGTMFPLVEEHMDAEGLRDLGAKMDAMKKGR